MRGRWKLWLLLLLALPFAAWGDAPPQVILAQAGGTADSPAIDRFTLRFSVPMVPLGDPRALPAATSDCPVPASGHWVDPQTFVLAFDHALAGGLRCKVTLRKDITTLAGIRLTGASDYTIDTAGPSVRAVLPSNGEIEEDQTFLVATNDPASLASVGAKVSCAVEGIGESAAVDVLPAAVAERVLTGLTGWERDSFLQDAGIADKLPADVKARAAALASVVALKCRRPLPPDHDVALVWPKEVVDAHGLAAGRDQRFDFHVREEFRASFSCDRPNSAAGCDPLLPAKLSFTAPIDRALALGVRLKLADGTLRAPREADDDKGNAQLSGISFAGPFPESTTASLILPANVRDLSGRTLSNAARFPLAVKFDAAPPLVKFAAGFGIVEAGDSADLPVTVRAVEPGLAGKIDGIAGRSARIADDDAAIADWLRKLDKAEENDVEEVKHGQDRNGEDLPSTYINHTREHLLLTGGSALKLALPGKGRDFEVVGVPLGGNGFHVVELASPALGKALLGRNVPRYVAAGALVTDMAVHFKWGRESSLVWVTSLANAEPVKGAAIRISDSCTGKLLASGTSDASGILKLGAVLPDPGMEGGCDESEDHPLMVSARTAGDMSFTLSSWTKGISPYDFDLSFGSSSRDEVIHTVFDRALVRIGETVHFKQILRKPIGAGFALGTGFTGKLTFAHLGSGTEFSQDVTVGPGGTSGDGSWTVPQGAPLGDYALRFKVGDKTIDTDQTIRVDEYKLPTMRATIGATDTAGGQGKGWSGALIQPASVPLSLFVGYLSGGGAGSLPVTLRTDFSDWFAHPKGWDRFAFGGEDVVEGTRPLGGDATSASTPSLPYAQTLPAVLGADGTAHADAAVSRRVDRMMSMTVEMDYPDANGTTMTASKVLTLYPAALQLGLRSDGWLMRGDDLRLQMVVLDLEGRPVSGSAVAVTLYSRQTITARRRLIGGFYAYDNQERVTKIAGGCVVSSDARGLADCRLAPGVSGEVTVVARVKDSSGREARAVKTVWLAGDDDWWFGGDNGDRMDVIPEQQSYKAGDTAQFQVRMPFREATALVTVEREGVLSSFVTHLSGQDPVVPVKIDGNWAPNVYVSVLAVRGRVGGWQLWLADLAKRWNLPFFRKDIAYPTAMVDLAKPAYRLGIAKIKVGEEAHRLAVSVSADRSRYAVRDQARVTVAVHRPDGHPAAGADVAFVAVDEALLQLMPNPSWDVLEAMMGERSLEVATSTAQMQVVGKRHYGRKAVAAGGGGGGDASAVNRENFQPVLLWKGHLPLDGQGVGHVAVPLSDSLSRFKLVAVATEGAQLFGTGETSVRTAQDLTIYPGLPPLVRTGDRYDAVFTLRNGSDHAMTVTARPTLQPLVAIAKPLTVTIAPGAAGEVRWTLDAPRDPGTLAWTIQAQSSDGKARDKLSVTQEVAPAVPVEVWAASLLRVGDPAPVIAPPAGALPGGFVSADFSDTLAAPLDGVRRYMADYPFGCFEQKLSKLVAGGDPAAWTALAAALPSYLDADGLIRYWPNPQEQGSAELTAYVLAMTSAAGLTIPEAPRARMVDALHRVVEGRLARERAYPADERLVRIAALAALARAGAAEPGLVARIDMLPTDMPTSTLADWLVTLDRLPAAPQAGPLRAAAEGELRRRMVWSGVRLELTDKARAPWWMMIGGDEMAIRALDAVLGKPGWSAEVPRMMAGIAARQWHGHWDTTPANAWGTLLARRFAAAFPASAVAGVTHVALGGHSANVSWPRHDSAPVNLPLVAAPMQLAQTGGQGAATGPWATISVHAAVPLTAPFNAGYRLTRTVTVISARQPGKLSQGDVIRVRLTIDPDAARTWVVIADPLPPGATVMSSLGQSALLQKGEQSGGAWPAWTESTKDSWRAYFDWLPRGTTTLEYTLRLNSAGRFTLPPLRAEAMYAPSIHGALPIAPVTIWGR